MIGVHCALGTVMSSLGHQRSTVTVTYAGQENANVGTLALDTDISTVAAEYRGHRMQVELLNYNGSVPVELRSISVQAEVLPHIGD